MPAASNSKTRPQGAAVPLSGPGALLQQISQVAAMGSSTVQAAPQLSKRSPSGMQSLMGCSNSQSLLDEWKAKEAATAANRTVKQATLTALRQQQVELQKQIQDLTGRDSRWWPERTKLQSQLAIVENGIRMMSTQEDLSAKKPLGAAGDAVNRFLQTVAIFLRKCEGCRALLSVVSVQPDVKKAWNELVMSRIIRKSTEMEQIIMEQSSLFVISHDEEGRPVVNIPGETGPPPAIAAAMMPAVAGYHGMPPAMYTGVLPPGQVPGQMLALQSSAAGGGATSAAAAGLAPLPVGPVPPGMVQGMGVATPPLAELHEEQIAAIEADLLRAGGQERFRKLCLQHSVQEGQLARRYRLYEVNGKMMVSHLNPELARLQWLLLTASPQRASVKEVMAHALDHAEKHALVLARCLIASFEVLDLDTDKYLARVYIINDILCNCGSAARGVASYRGHFQELLPDAFERLGRHWFKRTAPGTEHDRGSLGVRKVLEAWRKWEVFPQVFVAGLESLIFAPVDSATLEATEAAADMVLRHKLEGWKDQSKMGELRAAARLRGLAGAALPLSTCRLRLCNFECYWHERLAQQREAAAALEPQDSASMNGDACSDDDVAMEDAASCPVEEKKPRIRSSSKLPQPWSPKTPPA
eukprot:TRINITY_DN32403_c0_g1_i3.p1 TRINITY_DN32403_c0_g1~~TRINITY_DN32403_c0_g1_i3.p1  ORF type:complete len:641 (+),score=162.68 TRINITY_DN32403_c0_g1_i3:74-1996(+)